MSGIIAIILFIIWFRKAGRKHFAEVIATQAKLGARTEEGSREDYIRGYYSGSERFPNGNGQDSNGSGIGYNSKG